MVQGVKFALQLIRQAWDYLTTENYIFQLWFALILVIVVIWFFIGKLLNRD